MPALVWHRLNWSGLFPLVHLDNADELSLVAGGYIAGFNDSAITMRSVALDIGQWHWTLVSGTGHWSVALDISLVRLQAGA